MDYHPVVKKITDLLAAHSLWYETFIHAPVTTSEDAALTRPGYTLNQGAKALIVKVEKNDKREEYYMFVLPANLRLDSKKVRWALGLRSFRFASEEEIDSVTKGVKRGAIPPFGNIFNLPTYVDPLLFVNEKIVFNAGDRRFSVAMRAKDFQKLTEPTLLDIKEGE